MYNHEPQTYTCPFCIVVSGKESKKIDTNQADVVYKDRFVTAFIAAHWWPNNPGHVIIVPNLHIENIYDITGNVAVKIHRVAQLVAIAFKKVYECEGISTRQHNEPAGNQGVWHYHTHIFPRYTDDRLYELFTEVRLAEPAERKKYATKLKKYFELHP